MVLGGYSDLISYKITNLDPLQISESVSGIGTHPPTLRWGGEGG